MKACTIIGAGYIGAALAAHWIRKGYTVTVTTRQPSRCSSLQALGANVVLLEEDNPSTWQKALEASQVVAVTVAPSLDASYTDTYLKTASQLEAVLASCRGACPNHILYTSSTSVYGAKGSGWVDEDSPLIGNTSNAAVLIAAEKAFAALSQYGPLVTILRLGGIYGPGRSIVQRLRMLEGQALPGDGSSWTNLVHAEDVVRSLDFAAHHQLNGVFNVVNDLHMLRRDLYKAVCHHHGFSEPKWDTSRSPVHGGDKLVNAERLKKCDFNFMYNTLSSVLEC
jgi:nucleoside-diphosphate-sugar epimerase